MKFFHCERCGTLTTDLEISVDIESGSVGLCYCEYGSREEKGIEIVYSRVLNEWVEISGDEYDLLRKKKRKMGNLR